ncbi:MAG: hypothetical protein A4S12_02830 [Proteobacteria bacterium SG_bin5]|nr:MAG: hypothetical protein A4S12_02830 [Proteobacteria bacterium SG_bin5]
MFGGVLLFVWQASDAAIRADQRERVDGLRRELMTHFFDGGMPALIRAVADHSRPTGTPRDRALLLLLGADGRRLAGNLPAWPARVPMRTRWQVVTLPGLNGGEPLGVTSWEIPRGRLLIARSVAASAALALTTEEAAATGLVIGLLLALASALILGRLLAGQIEAMVATAGEVADGRLASRVPTDASGDAFDRLGQAINAMLDRIERLVSQLRMMTDGLAHDFRAPVTRLRAVVDQAAASTHDPTARAALDRAMAEADQLLAMLSTALLISRAEAGIGRDQFAPVDLVELLDDLAEVYGPLAEERGFAIRVRAPARITARLHRQLLLQALGNLIENATLYAEGGGTIELGAAALAGGARLWVADDGPDIPPEARGKALQRFGRLDPARRPGGSGLGLSLVEAVAHLHEGSLALEDNGPGLKAVLTIGAAAPG